MEKEVPLEYMEKLQPLLDDACKAEEEYVIDEMEKNMSVPLYCTICAEKLELDLYDHDFEANLICKNGHRWWYCMEDLERGNFLAF